MIFDIENGDVVAVAGSGGKTSLIKFLAEKAAKAGMRTLISTTTRLASDETKDGFDYLVCINGEKAEAPSAEELKSKIKDYDIILIEADGSACNPLKGWREDEPLIPEFANITIGVVDISMVGKAVNEEQIHRFDLFTKLTGLKAGERITVQAVARLVNHKSGLFGNSAHTANHLFCAKAESPEAMANARRLRPMLRDDIRLFAGSVQKGSVLELK